MDLSHQIQTGLGNQGLPVPTIQWIQGVMSARNPPPPLPALIATARSRLLAADLTTPALLEASAPAFPPNLDSAQVQETKLPRDILVQVLDIDNLSKSKWEQVEELEAIARGEQTRGREIIRLPTGNEADEEGDDSSATQSISGGSGRPGAAGRAGTASANATSKNSTHRLVLQDCRGQKVYALELRRVEKIGIGTLNIGEKIMLKKGATVARGVILLEPATCVVLGGKVEVWQKAWLEGRLARLKEAVGADRPN
ncbi:hypothetical protein DL764_001603 [Monosporascus ibericus]|uniref:RecQ-mediated genome instability protein 1 n=1 Tax=Monosporascus ibericus TaxID=155417 RepID=A0A4Q4TTS0_9PEZI|nr:hypothetical protein DL764_001603 [Monosporascus ibericus]